MLWLLKNSQETLPKEKCSPMSKKFKEKKENTVLINYYIKNGQLLN
jgi:hypothetical protein